MKSLMMLAVVVSAISAQAAVSRVDIYIKNANAASALSDLDIDDKSTIRTAAYSDADTTWQGSQEPYTGAKNYGIRKEGNNFEEVSGLKVTGTLSEGYSVYLIQGTSFTAIKNMLADENTSVYNDFIKAYASSQVAESSGNAIKQMNYGNNSTTVTTDKRLTLTGSVDISAESVASPDTMVAVFTYLNENGDAAQYNVIASDGLTQVREGVYSYYFGGTALTSSDATGWQDFASIPEPTSGLLMLLGMAGLALRRRRA